MDAKYNPIVIHLKPSDPFVFTYLGWTLSTMRAQRMVQIKNWEPCQWDRAPSATPDDFNIAISCITKEQSLHEPSY